jgi:hypothetical protein
VNVKRGLAIFLTVVVCVQFSGLYCIFVIRILQLHAERAERLSHASPEEFEILELSVSDYDQARVEDSELEINGRMYDVAKIEVAGSRVKLLVLADDDEDSILTLMDFCVKKGQRNGKTSRLIVKVFTSLYLPSKFFLQFSPCSNTSPLMFDEMHYHSLKPSIGTPPPKYRVV